MSMTSLARSIPALVNMPGIDPWQPLLLEARWGTASGGERAAIQFVLSVFDPQREQYWRVPPFSLDDFSRLDEINQRAIAQWFTEPFWP